ncbi:MAG: hypothetical protein HYV63_33435 [Candidatus Schekmanbacteria bacterium]|nr:hypothetical protein [Candidatus Schekmanbacteria bacterium]
MNREIVFWLGVVIVAALFWFAVVRILLRTPATSKRVAPVLSEPGPGSPREMRGDTPKVISAATAPGATAPEPPRQGAAHGTRGPVDAASAAPEPPESKSRTPDHDALLELARRVQDRAQVLRREVVAHPKVMAAAVRDFIHQPAANPAAGVAAAEPDPTPKSSAGPSKKRTKKRG